MEQWVAQTMTLFSTLHVVMPRSMALSEPYDHEPLKTSIPSDRRAVHRILDTDLFDVAAQRIASKFEALSQSSGQRLSPIGPVFYGLEVVPSQFRIPYATVRGVAYVTYMVSSPISLTGLPSINNYEVAPNNHIPSTCQQTNTAHIPVRNTNIELYGHTSNKDNAD